MTGFTDIEREVIVLNATRGMIDDMVNHAIFMPLGDNRHETNLMPTTSEALRQFGTLLRDFLSPVTTKGSGPLPFGLPRPPNADVATDHTTLFYLHRIGENPLLGDEIAPLKNSVQVFKDWLDVRIIVPNVWLSKIGLELDLNIKRIDFIRISGDIGKHNFMRLAGQARRIQQILKENGQNIDDGEAYMVLPDAWDWFHTHLLGFHASNIAEFLNNIRFSIRDYLTPSARAAFFHIDHAIQHVVPPSGIVDKFALDQYFELLQSTLHQPYFPQFSVSKNFKTRF